MFEKYAQHVLCVLRMNTYVSLDEVAKAAGVTKSTVSRVLNGKGDQNRIRETTQARVRDAVRQLGYARSPITRFTHVAHETASPATIAPQPHRQQIGLVLSSNSPASSLAFIPNLEPTLDAADYELVVLTLPDDPEAARRRLTGLLQRIAGMVCCPILHPVVTAITGVQYPVVVLWQGAAQAILAKLGHEVAEPATFKPESTAQPIATPTPATPRPPLVVIPVVTPEPTPIPVVVIEPTPIAPEVSPKEETVAPEPELAAEPEPIIEPAVTPEPIEVPEPVIEPEPVSETPAPLATPETVPESDNQEPPPEPVVEPAPVVAAEPEPVVVPEPIQEVTVQPQPELEASIPQPQETPPPMATPEPEPAPVVEPIMTPPPVEETPPPIAVPEPDPIVIPEPEPVTIQEPEPAPVQEPPVAASETPPTEPTPPSSQTDV